MAKKVGKRAAVKQQAYQLNQIVSFRLDDETIIGQVIELVGQDYRVVTESGRRFVCEANEFKLPICTVSGCGGEATRIDGLCDECRATGMDQDDDSIDEDLIDRRKRKDPERSYAGVSWDPDTVNFSVTSKTEGVRFYGWWRKTKGTGGDLIYSIDLFAERDGKTYTLDRIPYRGVDPRDNLKSLNADISAHCQRWMFHNFSDNAENIDSMRRRAEKPTVLINRIGTIDRLILQLKEFRDVAIRCGGTRHFELLSDKDGLPPVLINLNVTAQAIALDGKPPSLHMGAMMDAAVATKGRAKLTPGTTTAAFKADPKNIEELQKQLIAMKAAGNDGECRKIRATLRQLGIKGGARSLAKAAQST